MASKCLIHPDFHIAMYGTLPGWEKDSKDNFQLKIYSKVRKKWQTVNPEKKGQTMVNY